MPRHAAIVVVVVVKVITAAAIVLVPIFGVWRPQSDARRKSAAGAHFVALGDGVVASAFLLSSDILEGIVNVCDVP